MGVGITIGAGAVVVMVPVEVEESVTSLVFSSSVSDPPL